MIRLRNRVRRCQAVAGYEPCCCGVSTADHHSGWPVDCDRPIGWWRSWWSEHCREHREGDGQRWHWTPPRLTVYRGDRNP